MIDFKAEVLKIKDQMIDDIKMLCAILQLKMIVPLLSLLPMAQQSPSFRCNVRNWST